MAAGIPEGFKKARPGINETWNPGTPLPDQFVPRTLGWNYTLDQRTELWKIVWTVIWIV